MVEHGGILEKFIGDAVVAVFGFPQTHDDDPARALSAALALRDHVQHDAVLGERLPIRIGINTGEVVAIRESATGDFPLTGDAVNVAARLQTAAEPWGIICGERTVASARAAFEFGPAQMIDVRGKSQPIRALPLLGRAQTSRVATRTALIGRDARSGASFDSRVSTRMASNPAQIYGLAPSDPPHSMRSARPARMRSNPSITASVPVLQALELVVT